MPLSDYHLCLHCGLYACCFLRAFQVAHWAGRRLTPGVHFLPFSGFRSSWLEEVEGLWDVES